MVVIENEFTVPVPPKAVWRALTDLERYAEWHPSLRLDGVAEGEGEIGFVVTNTVIGRDTPRVPARITRFEPERALGWRMGLRLLFLLDETYELSPHRRGTGVRHRIAYGGLGATVARARLATHAHGAMSKVDVALQKHVASRGFR